MSYRVIQWATGNVGKNAIKAVAEHSDLTLAGLYVHGAAKHGLDAGEICGIEPLGVAATNDIDETLAINADCVLHMPLPSEIYGKDPAADVKNICRALRAGKNVITVVGFMYPKIYGPDVMGEFEDACKAGGATFHGTGLNPGMFGDLLPLVLSALSRRIERIYVIETTNFSFYPSPDIIFEMMGMGKPPAEFAQHTARYKRWLNGLFRENVQMIADGLGLALDTIDETMETQLTDKAYKISAGPVAAGPVGAQRWKWSGIADGVSRIEHETVWRIHKDIAPNWPQSDNRVQIDGEPAMKIDFGQTWISDGLLATAMHAVNAIPAVCEAAPGVKTFLDLPMIFGRGRVGSRTI
jgi:hypothetical protein